MLPTFSFADSSVQLCFGGAVLPAPSLSPKGGPSHAWVHHVDPKPHPQACWLHVTFRKGLSLAAVAVLQVKPALRSYPGASLCRWCSELGVLGELPQMVEVWAEECCPFHMALGEQGLTWRGRRDTLMGFFPQHLKANYVLPNYGRSFTKLGVLLPTIKTHFTELIPSTFNSN